MADIKMSLGLNRLLNWMIIQTKGSQTMWEPLRVLSVSSEITGFMRRRAELVIC